MRRDEADDVRVGPVVSVGFGGVQADTIADEVSRLAPVSVASAVTMIQNTRAAAALEPHTIDGLADVLARVAQLASEHHEIAELDLNPVIVTREECWVVDARLQLRHPEGGPTARRLDVP